jgi:quercetin dioxygenase-like cupin family protein
MSFNLKEKSNSSKDKEFWYGAMVNKNIQDVYLGLGFLESGEEGRKGGPPRGHEEIIYSLDGQIEIITKESSTILNEGELLFLPDGTKIKIKNLSEKKVQFIVAGGHTKHHKH